MLEREKGATIIFCGCFFPNQNATYTNIRGCYEYSRYIKCIGTDVPKLWKAKTQKWLDEHADNE